MQVKTYRYRSARGFRKKSLLRMIDRNLIVETLRAALQPLPYVHALWLEGADAGGMLDAYSDIDLWVDVDDDSEAAATDAVEAALQSLSPIDARHIIPHGHPKIRQRVYHLASSSPYLMIDFCWQLHSRDRKDSALVEGDAIESAKVIFDKSGVVHYLPDDPERYLARNRERLKACEYRYSQHCRVIKYVRRGQYPEAYAYYHRYVVEPLIDLLRLIHTPAHADYYLVHISQHIPQAECARLEEYLKAASLVEIEEKTETAQAWYAQLMAQLAAKGI